MKQQEGCAIREGTFGEDPSLQDYPLKVTLLVGVRTAYQKLPSLVKLKSIIVALVILFSLGAICKEFH